MRKQFREILKLRTLNLQKKSQKAIEQSQNFLPTIRKSIKKTSLNKKLILKKFTYNLNNNKFMYKKIFLTKFFIHKNNNIL